MGKLGSVQRQFVLVREVLDDVLAIADPSSPNRRRYLAVLNVPLIHFQLKAEEEQEALIERYRTLLKSLTFPLQIIVRHERLDLSDYQDRILKQVPSTDRAPAWQGLAEGLVTMLREHASQRTLIDRHCYLVVPAPDQSLRLRGRRRPRTAAILARVQQDLTLRVEMLQQQISGLGLRATRLRGEAIVQLYARCMTPERFQHHPLRASHFAAVGQLPSRTSVQTMAELIPPPEVAPPLTRKHDAQQKANRSHPDGLPPFDLLRLADLLAPGSIEEYADALCIDGEWTRAIAITALPHEVTMGGWLAPLLQHDETIEIVFHIHPQPVVPAMRALKRRHVGYSATRGFNQRQGRADPDQDLAQRHVDRLMSRLASGEERPFELTFLVLVRAADRAMLDERTDRVLSLLQTVLLDAVAHPTTFEQAKALRSFLPHGRDELRRTIPLDASSVASIFPFMSNALLMPGGIFLGFSGRGDPVLFDPWHESLENPHILVVGPSGTGKSVVLKALQERSLLLHGLRGEQHATIDLDGEYRLLTEALGGATVVIAPGSASHLNPFDLLPPGSNLETYQASVKHADRLAEKVGDILSLLEVMVADPGSSLSQREKAFLDRSVYETYRRVGIGPDLRTHYHQPPLLRDLLDVLANGSCGKDEFDLCPRLARYTEGSLAGLFANATNVPLDTHLLRWDISEMRGDLCPIGIVLIFDRTWTQAIYGGTVPRCLTIDEVATLTAYVAGGRFLATMSQRLRKRYMRIICASQNGDVFIENEWGRIIAANAATKIMKRQDRTSGKAIASSFGLTQAEANQLLAFGVHESLVIAGDRRVVVNVPMNAREHALMTTNPVELARAAQEVA